MKTRQTLLGFLFLSIIGTGAGYVLGNAYKLGICGASTFCGDIINAGDALLYGMSSLVVVFLVLLIIPRTFPAWGRFAIWFVPFMLIYFVGYEDKSHGFFSFSIPETVVYQFLCIVFLIWSAVVVGWDLLSKKLNKNAAEKTHVLPKGKILRTWWYVYLVAIALVIVFRFLG